MRRLVILVPVLALAACEARPVDDVSGSVALALPPSELEARVVRFEPADIEFDDSVLEPWEKQVIAKLIDASDVMHAIFMEQVSPENPAWRAQLEALDAEGADAARTLFDIMVGPWDRLEDHAPFLDVGTKPEGAGYYPPDLTREEFEAWLGQNPGDREAFTGYFTLIRRDGAGLVAIPYSQAYQEKLDSAATLLREAAALSENASLTNYLNLRAAAFLTDDYYASDLAWMDLDSRVEPTIGPYEVYEDALFGYKAAFESFITVADSAASAELQQLKDWLPRLEAALPVPPVYRNPDRSFESPIRVVDEVYTGGDTRAGVQTTAFNLPNDVRVHEQKGSKKVMLRNVLRAKFDRILSRISAVVLSDSLASRVAFEPWFTNVVMHELAHGLGPTTITLPSGERGTVNQALRDQHSALEEAKADVVGLHSLTVLADRGMYDRAFVERAFAGHLADLFRAVRFGVSEAHGKANLIQFTWLRENNALRVDSAGRFEANIEDVIRANRALATEILQLQAHGVYEDAVAFTRQYGSAIPPEMQAALDRLGEVPVDIRPAYSVLRLRGSW